MHGEETAQGAVPVSRGDISGGSSGNTPSDTAPPLPCCHLRQNSQAMDSGVTTSFPLRFGESACQAVNVLVQIGGYVLPKRIEDEPHAFPACQLRRRNKIRVAGNKDDDVRMALERERCDIQTDSHIDPLLP